MDLIYSTMSPPWKRAVNIAIALTLIVCTAYTAMQSWKVVMLHYRNHGVTAGTDIPLVFPHLGVAVRLHLHGARGNGAHPLLYLRQIRVKGQRCIG